MAAHRKLYGEDFTAETAEDYLSISSGSPQAMFRNGETKLYSGFAVNHTYPMDEDGMGYTAATAPLADGDVVELFYYEDASYCDYLTWFADGSGQPLDTVRAEAGQPFTLYLRASSRSRSTTASTRCWPIRWMRPASWRTACATLQRIPARR